MTSCSIASLSYWFYEGEHFNDTSQQSHTGIISFQSPLTGVKKCYNIALAYNVD